MTIPCALFIRVLNQNEPGYFREWVPASAGIVFANELHELHEFLVCAAPVQARDKLAFSLCFVHAACTCCKYFLRVEICLPECILQAGYLGWRALRFLIRSVWRIVNP